MTKEEILRETIEHYSVPGRRSYNEEIQNCCYKHSNGNMCAVGRVLKPEALDIAIQKCNTNGIDVLVREVCAELIKDRTPVLDDILRDEYKGHDRDFWIDMQTLHDGSIYWNFPGLSLSGKEKVYQLIAKHALVQDELIDLLITKS